MKGFVLASFAVALMVCHVYALYSHKCKEAETSNDKLVRFIENANCTILEGKRQFREGFNHFHSMFKQGMDRVHNKMTNIIPSVNMPGNVPVNVPEDSQSGTTEEAPVKIYSNTPVNTTPSPPLEVEDEYKGLDHQIDIRMLQYNDAPRSRKKRDDVEGKA